MINQSLSESSSIQSSSQPNCPSAVFILLFSSLIDFSFPTDRLPPWASTGHKFFYCFGQMLVSLFLLGRQQFRQIEKHKSSICTWNGMHNNKEFQFKKIKLQFMTQYIQVKQNMQFQNMSRISFPLKIFLMVFLYLEAVWKDNFKYVFNYRDFLHGNTV